PESETGYTYHTRNRDEQGHESATARVDLGREPPQSLRPPRLAGSLRAAGRRLRRVDHLPHWKGLREEIRSGRRYRYLALRSAGRRQGRARLRDRILRSVVLRLCSVLAGSAGAAFRARLAL